jgi:hypothetical protein
VYVIKEDGRIKKSKLHKKLAAWASLKQVTYLDLDLEIERAIEKLVRKGTVIAHGEKVKLVPSIGDEEDATITGCASQQQV